MSMLWTCWWVDLFSCWLWGPAEVQCYAGFQVEQDPWHEGLEEWFQNDAHQCWDQQNRTRLQKWLPVLSQVPGWGVGGKLPSPASPAGIPRLVSWSPSPMFSFSMWCFSTGFWVKWVCTQHFKSRFSFPNSYLVFLDVFPVVFKTKYLGPYLSCPRSMGLPDVELESLTPQKNVSFLTMECCASRPNLCLFYPSWCCPLLWKLCLSSF